MVIPCYDCGGTLRRAVRSALDQTLPPLEIIVVDDASRDDSALVLEQLQHEFPRAGLRWIRLDKNRGPGAARNAGWNAARGKFVAFLDADDAWHPRKLEVQINFMRCQPFYTLTGHRHAFHGQSPRSWTDEPHHVELGFTRLLHGSPFSTPSLIVHRDLPLRFPADRRYGEDYVLLVQAKVAGYRMARIELDLVTLFKPAYGASGLSAAIWEMERGELQTFLKLRRAGAISLPMMIWLVVWSLAKFLRRAMFTGWRRITSRP